MRSMETYPRAAMERAMKVQDVMLQAMAKKITWWQAAEILGISDRHMRRWRERYVEEGYNGLLDRRRGKPSRRRVALATVEKVFALYREKYFDLNVRHFHEKLEAEHGIELSYTWVKQALQLRYQHVRIIAGVADRDALRVSLQVCTVQPQGGTLLGRRAGRGMDCQLVRRRRGFQD